MHPRRVEVDAVEQRRASLRLVAFGIAGREEALVPPPHVEPSPVDRVAGGRAVEVAEELDPDRASGEYDGGSACRRLGVDDPRDEPGRACVGKEGGVTVHEDRGARAHTGAASAAACSAGSRQMCVRSGERAERSSFRPVA